MRSLRTRRETAYYRRYLFAVGAVAAATLATALLRLWMPEQSPNYVLFFAAVAVSAGYGGFWPGVASAFLAAFIVDYFYIDPLLSLSIDDHKQSVQLALFQLVGVVISGMSEWLRSAVRRAEGAWEETESARRRVSFLAKAGVALDSSLDYATTLDSLAHIIVPTLADWCAIDILESDNSIRPLAVAHIEPGKEALVRSLQCRYPLDAQGRHPVQSALKTEQANLFQDIPESAVVAAGRDEGHLNALRALNIRSYLCVPMRGRSGMLGTILFVSAARLRYNETDRTLAEDLARRAALALDNARLYQDAQEEIRERMRTEEELARNQEEVKALNERLRRSMVETHHRVKNNLQIITAMVDMRLMEDKETVSVEEIKRLKAYIYALAAVHDILTQEAKQEGEEQSISVKAILEKLLPLMQQTAGNRHIDYALEDARLSAKQGTSLALIVNELVSNAIKYGRGEIVVRMRVSDAPPGGTATAVIANGHTPQSSAAPTTVIEAAAKEAEATQQLLARLEVCDDGPGFPPNFDPGRAANTGLDLIENLSRWDLGGKALFENRPEGGGRVVISFPLTGTER